MIDPFEQIHDPEQCGEQMIDATCTLEEREVCDPPEVEVPSIEQIL